MMLGRWTGGKFLRIDNDSKGFFVTPTEGQKRYFDPKTFALE